MIKYIEEVWNKANTEAFNDLTAQDFSYHPGGQPTLDKLPGNYFNCQSLMHSLTGG